MNLRNLIRIGFAVLYLIGLSSCSSKMQPLLYPIEDTRHSLAPYYDGNLPDLNGLKSSINDIYVALINDEWPTVYALSNDSMKARFSINPIKPLFSIKGTHIKNYSCNGAMVSESPAPCGISGTSIARVNMFIECQHGIQEGVILMEAVDYYEYKDNKWRCCALSIMESEPNHALQRTRTASALHEDAYKLDRSARVR